MDRNSVHEKQEDTFSIICIYSYIMDSALQSTLNTFYLSSLTPLMSNNLDYLQSQTFSWYFGTFGYEYS